MDQKAAGDYHLLLFFSRHFLYAAESVNSGKYSVHEFIPAFHKMVSVVGNWSIYLRCRIEEAPIGYLSFTLL